VLVVVLLVAGCGGNRERLRLSVTPASALFDVPFDVRVTGAGAGERVTITVLARSRLDKLWRSVLTTHADAHGYVDLRNQYLLARLRPIRAPAENDYLPGVRKQTEVTMVARASRRTATAYTQRIRLPASVSVAEERPSRVGFYGEWFTPRDARHRTAVLLLGGSEGGLPNYLVAPLLAAHGYPVLALAYFREPGLPKALARIPLEYFQRALRWMRARPEADPQRIVAYGFSFGGQLSLLLSSMFPDLIRGTVDYVGTDVATGSPVAAATWTYHGKPVLGPIPLDRIIGPVFAVGGGEDALTSFLSIEDIAHELRGHDRRDVTLIYARAGHLVGEAVPNRPELATTGETLYGKADFGGSPQADEAARENSWPKLLNFLAHI
jgi:dienelactone hydrolase